MSKRVAGFSEAELAAAEWRRLQPGYEEPQKRRPDGSRKKESSRRHRDDGRHHRDRYDRQASSNTDRRRNGRRSSPSPSRHSSSLDRLGNRNGSQRHRGGCRGYQSDSDGGDHRRRKRRRSERDKYKESSSASHRGDRGDRGEENNQGDRSDRREKGDKTESVKKDGPGENHQLGRDEQKGDAGLSPSGHIGSEVKLSGSRSKSNEVGLDPTSQVNDSKNTIKGEETSQSTIPPTKQKNSSNVHRSRVTDDELGNTLHTSLRPSEVTALKKIKSLGAPSNPLGMMYQATTVGVVVKGKKIYDVISGTERVITPSCLPSKTEPTSTGDKTYSENQDSSEVSQVDTSPKATRSPPRRDASRSVSHSRSDDSLNSSVSSRVHRGVNAPRDPVNPLDAAYDTYAYRMMKKKRWASPPSKGEREPEWRHDRYLNRSESPNRERTEGPMWDTRKDAWISRAGGAYIPPRPRDGREDERDEREEDWHRSASPARYRYPEQFHRIRSDRARSPSDRSRDSPRYELD
eukprot:GHVN01077307.1.p1 GENE.GHVN01077307.1~~GHVN01077307.1.p1  ORF type:complete len:518 (+),score=109.06 GHVN01077307.1:58-1611(+)